VVNGLLRGLVEASVDGSLKVADVEDVGRRVVDETTELSCRRAGLVELIKLVVKEEGGHSLVDDPTLVRVCVTDVWGRADDRRLLLVGGIVDSQGVFVVTEADLFTHVFRVGALVDHTLCVVNVAIETYKAKSSCQHVVLVTSWVRSISLLPIQPGEVGLLGSDTSTMKRPPAHLVLRELAPLRPPTA